MDRLHTSTRLSHQPTTHALAYDQSDFDAELRAILSLDDDNPHVTEECLTLNGLSSLHETLSCQPMTPALDHDKSDFDAELRAILSLDDDIPEQALECMDLKGRSHTSETHLYNPMARGEDAGRPKTKEAEKNEKRAAKLLWRKITADLAKLRPQNGRISLHYLDALTSLARNVQAYSSLSRCGSKKNGTPALESINKILEDSYLCLQRAEESKLLDQQLKGCYPFSQPKHCTPRLSTTKVFCKSNKRSYDNETPSDDIIYPKRKRAKIEPDKPSKRKLVTLLASMHTVVRQIKAQLTVITKKKETWVESVMKVAHFDENLWEVLALDLSEYERMEQIRRIERETKEALEGDMRLVIEKLKGANKDMRRVTKELKGKKDRCHVVDEVKDLSNDIRLVMSELVKMNQCMQFVPIRKKLKKMTKEGHHVDAELALMEKEETVAANLGTKGHLGVAKPRGKATGDLDVFRRRELRLNTMRKALEQASMGGPRIKYAAIWTELDEMWYKLMAHDREKSFARKSKCAKKVGDKPMKTFDADLDKLESWISAL